MIYQKFIENILYKKLSAKYIFVSNNFKFGYKRKGNVDVLKNFQLKYNYKLINPKPLTKKNKIISSTLIRKLLQNGDLNTANKILKKKLVNRRHCRKRQNDGKKNWISNMQY